MVVAIIMLLGALLLPALRRARERSQQAVCLNNLKQLYLAWNLYANDNTGVPPQDYVFDLSSPIPGPWWVCLYVYQYVTQPNATDWVSMVDKNGIMMCPRVKQDPYYYWNLYPLVAGWAECSYGVNTEVSSSWPRTMHWQRLARPSETLLFTDCTRQWDSFLFNAGRVASGLPMLSARHLGGLNLVFCDGHVEWRAGPMPTPLPYVANEWPWFENQY